MIDTDKPPRLAFTVTSARVQHYGDVVEYLVANAVRKCQEEGWTPTKVEVDFFRKEVTRYAVIRQDVETASKLKINRQHILNE
jgi:hypothetical protein